MRAWRQEEHPGGDTLGDRKESLVLERITFLGDGRLDLALPICEDEGTATEELTAFSLVHSQVFCLCLKVTLKVLAFSLMQAQLHTSLSRGNAVFSSSCVTKVKRNRKINFHKALFNPL